MIIKTTAAAVSVLCAFALAGAASAQEDPNPWQHCGIGAMVFPETPVAAAVSNIIWDLGTTAVTSAASSPDTCSGNTAMTAMFINQTYPQLAAETAVGRGEHLIAVAELMGCDAAVHEPLIADVRKSVAIEMSATGFDAKSRSEKAEAYFNTVNTTVRSQYADSCAIG